MTRGCIKLNSRHTMALRLGFDCIYCKASTQPFLFGSIKNLAELRGLEQGILQHFNNLTSNY